MMMSSRGAVFLTLIVMSSVGQLMVNGQPTSDSSTSTCCCDEQQQQQQRVSRMLLQQLTERVDTLEQLVMKVTINQPSPSLTTSRQSTQMNRRRLVSVLKQNVTVPEGKGVSGLATLSNTLYVARIDELLELYDANTLVFLRHLTIPGMGCVSDIASCSVSKLIYVADYCNRWIHAVDEYEATVHWSTIDKPYSVSVNSRCNVIVVFHEIYKLHEFTSSGELVREITLQSDIIYPLHAIQLVDDRYIVAHGNRSDPSSLHRVCIVSSNGTAIQCYGGTKGSGVAQLDTPGHLALFGSSLIVSDFYNQRLILLNVTEFNVAREIISSSTMQDRRAARITLSEDGNGLYVTYNNRLNETRVIGHVGLFQLNWI